MVVQEKFAFGPLFVVQRDTEPYYVVRGRHVVSGLCLWYGSSRAPPPLLSYNFAETLGDGLGDSRRAAD